MILIKKNKKGMCYVSYVAKNGEILATSESFTSKQSTWKNIIAMYKNFPPAVEPWYVKVTDMTGKKPQLYLFNLISKTKQKC
jgi:uncharacterized protein YegP (UPF0339 family)